MSQSVAETETILLTRGVPAVEALPTHLISECLQSALEGSDGKGILQYGHNGGYLPLRRMISEQYNVNENQVLVGNGSLHLQDLLAALLVQPGDTVLTEQPSYDRAIRTFRRRGATTLGVPLDLDGVNLELLEAELKRKTPAFMYVIPDFQNPAGVTTSEAKRRRLVELAEEYNFWLLEDVPYRTLRYWGESLPLLRDISPKRVVTLSSYSKLISPALRVGYAVGPAELIEKLKELAEETILAPVLPTQAAVVEFFNKGYFDSNLENLKQLYAPRLQAMIAAIKKYLPDVAFAEPEGGFFVSITLPESANTANLLGRAKQAGLQLTDGGSFFANSLDGSEIDGARFIRLPFCALTTAQIDEGLRRLAELVK